MSRNKSVVMWISIGLAALSFGAAGAAKLMGAPQLHASFAIMGFPVWVGYFIGASELAGALGLLLRRVSIIAAGGLVAIMLGAIFFHVRYETVANAVPALLLTVLLITIMVLRIGSLRDISQLSADA